MNPDVRSSDGSAQPGPASFTLVPSERVAIREQLSRLLLSPGFRNSRKYPAFLRHIVEESLEGRAGELKERTLGVRVFGRAPDYDTNADPVVRTTAAEVRKRIAQYYHKYAAPEEIRIDLPPGAYQPEFRPPAHIPSNDARARITASQRRWALYITAGVLVTLATFYALSVRVPRRTVLDRFWAPVLDSSGPIVLCVGPPVPQTAASAPAPAGPVSVSELERSESQHVALSDTMALSLLASVFRMHGRPYQIRPDSSVSLRDLRAGPVVLIGAFNNTWTRQFTSDFRFSLNFDEYSRTFTIVDRENPSQHAWQASDSVSYLKLSADYAVVARVRHPTTEQPLVVAAGLTRFGTVAAGEFLTTEAYVEELARVAPRDWEKRNLEVVLTTSVINGESGPPRILAVHCW